MRRVWLALLLVLLAAAPAAAHSANLTAHVGWQAPDTLTFRVLDVYESPLEGLAVTVRGPTGVKIPAVETAPGLYAAQLPGVAGQVTLEFSAGGDLFRAASTAGGAQDRQAEPVALAQFERGAQAWIEPAIFGAGVVVLLLVLGSALMRARPVKTQGEA
ncbi:MAG TPA: hypothetical protein VNT75_18750 [Symbiobacteriaceae bacterium]|nr:hypothetical protein [Symbiobacteriaceae bacterium]